MSREQIYKTPTRLKTCCVGRRPEYVEAVCFELLSNSRCGQHHCEAAGKCNCHNRENDQIEVHCAGPGCAGFVVPAIGVVCAGSVMLDVCVGMTSSGAGGAVTT